MAVALVPASGSEVVGESSYSARDRPVAGEDPARLRCTDLVVQERLGPGVVGLAEAVGAVDWDGDGDDLDLATEDGDDVVEGGKAVAFGWRRPRGRTR